jgi:hypothetical protein
MWLHQALVDSAIGVPEEAEGYCLGRGLPESIMQECRVGVWNPPEEPSPDAEFTRRFGARGDAVAGWLSIPLWAPSGKLLGVEFRRWQGDKAVMKHYLPPSKWTATFAGMSHTAMERIWAGADVWLVEGIFDLALAHVAQGVVLACGGARLSHAHAQFISRFLRRGATAYVCFDEDATGRGMAEGRMDNTGAFHKGAKQALERVNVNVQVVRYRGGKDPGEIWDSGGRAALRAAFSQYLSRSVSNG